MSFIETLTSYPGEFCDTLAKMTASIVQEQLAPIVETLREHARLLNLHAALLNHSTAMSRYNVGKIDDIRDFQNNINFKLQFHENPEDRWHPNYENPRTLSASASTETLSNADCDSRLPAADAHSQAEEPTHLNSSSVVASLGLPDCPSSPAATEPADSRPTTPRQQLGDGFSVVPGPSRRLQRERPFSVAPDPMWNSSREILPNQRLATRAPPPPYVLPPTYTEVVSSGQAVEEVVYLEPFPVETVEIEPSTLQTSTLDGQDVSVSPDDIPFVPEDAHNTPSHTFGPSWTFMSTTQAPNLTASEDDASEDPDPYVESQVTTSADGTHEDPPHVPEPLTVLWATETEDSTTPENETGNVDFGDENPNAGSQLSEKARGKKRMREEDYSSDEKDDTEMLEDLLGGSYCSGSGGCHPSNSSTSSDRDGQPDRKRMKTDTDTDTRVNTDRLGVDGSVLMVARMGLFETLTDAESCSQVKKLKNIEKLYRSGRLSLA